MLLLETMTAQAVLMLLFGLVNLLQGVLGQGQRCEAPSDCTSEYAPFCSKWGWCVWTELYGEEGPPQSAGAEEDGERGQCRSDEDCTKWAPNCSPLGYCRSGFWDGSFGAPSNPRPGQEPSQWIKDNASKYKTGTKENPNPNNVKTDSPADRTTPTAVAGQRQGSGISGGSRGGSGGTRVGLGGSNPPRGGVKDSNYQDEIQQGRIPGVPGKDYPTNSIKSVRNKYQGIKPAPQDKIPKNYPSAPKSGNRSKPSQNRSNPKGSMSNQNRKSQGQAGNGGGSKGCPGSLDECMASCPSAIKVFQACVASCGRRCRRK